MVLVSTSCERVAIAVLAQRRLHDVPLGTAGRGSEVLDVVRELRVDVRVQDLCGLFAGPRRRRGGPERRGRRRCGGGSRRRTRLRRDRVAAVRRRLRSARGAVAREVAALFINVPEEDVTVTVTVHVTPEAEALWQEAEAAERESRAAQERSATARRRAVAIARADRYSLDAAAAAFGVSRSRVQQLERAAAS